MTRNVNGRNKLRPAFSFLGGRSFSSDIKRAAKWALAPEELPFRFSRLISAAAIFKNTTRAGALGEAQPSPARERWVSATKNEERRRCGTSRARTHARARNRIAVVIVALAFLSASSVAAESPKTKTQSVDSLDAYLATARKSAPADARTLGSLWDPNGRMSDLATDTKARFVGDLVTINIIESTNSAQQESAQTSRAFSASSSLAALLGTTNARAANLFSPNSTQSLNGKGQTALATSLTTTLAASVTEVLPNGNLVIEARRDVLVTNQKETMILRGIIRREDLSPANVVASTAISHLEVSLKGNGVISETTREPNVIVRILLRVLNF